MNTNDVKIFRTVKHDGKVNWAIQVKEDGTVIGNIVKENGVYVGSLYGTRTVKKGVVCKNISDFKILAINHMFK